MQLIFLGMDRRNFFQEQLIVSHYVQFLVCLAVVFPGEVLFRHQMMTLATQLFKIFSR